MIAYYHLGVAGAVWGNKGVLGSEVLIKISKSRERFVAQVSLRWGYEQGIIIVTKSFYKERLKKNREIFN